jgi:hypothetical protein
LGHDRTIILQYQQQKHVFDRFQVALESNSNCTYQIESFKIAFFSWNLLSLNSYRILLLLYIYYLKEFDQNYQMLFYTLNFLVIMVGYSM